MCDSCGCDHGEEGVTFTLKKGNAAGHREAAAGGHEQGHEHGHKHEHEHGHEHEHELGTGHEHGHGPGHGHGTGHEHAHAHGAGSAFAAGHQTAAPDRGRRLEVARDLLDYNNRQAAHNREHLRQRRILALNLVSSPGSGKTTILEQTITRLAGRRPMAVIEGDQQTLLDAQRIEQTGVPVVQVNTGSGCHLDAAMVHRALHELDPANGTLLFIENVGNLVCPAMFDLGEAAKVVIISVTEGEDKPLKYPAMFAAAKLCLINKIDLLPHLNFDLEKCRAYARQVNPELRFINLSASSGEGMEQWLAALDKMTVPGQPG